MSKLRAQRGSDPRLGLGRNQKANDSQIKQKTPATSIMWLRELSARGTKVIAEMPRIETKLINALTREMINAGFMD
jgi:hypothetical protein